jgi:DNA-binding XRE family transcriptional regulator
MPQPQLPGKGLSSVNERHTGGPNRGRPPLRSVPDLGPGSQSRTHIGERLRDFRIKSRLSQEQAAAYAGLTRKSIARLENARFPNPHLSTLLRLMTTYHVSSLEELLGTTPSARLAAAWKEEGWDAAQEETS